MQYDIAIGDRVRRVTLTRDGQAWRASIDGTLVDVHAARVDGATLSLLLADAPGAVPARSVRTSVRPAKTGGGEFDVYVEGRHVSATVREAGAARRRGAAAAGTGAQRLTSPMPGKVVRVLVREGDQVAARQGLVVVEAMKMENELRASKTGRVVSVSVVEGQSVDAGAVLAVVE